MANKKKASQIIPIQPIIQGLLSIADHKNNIPPSHYRHQDQIISEEIFNRTTFLYDAAIWAILLNRTGHGAKAKHVLDFLAHQYHRKSGMTGIFEGEVCFRNAFDLHTGEGIVEWFMTPGPIAFMIFAHLDFNMTDKNPAYRRMAIALGHVLLKMQKRDGGVYDGDRNPDVVNTEPHMDCFMAFLRLYRLTNDEIWMTAAQEAYDFFTKNLCDFRRKMIYQGTLRTNPFATDAYTWTLLGKAGEIISPEELIEFTDFYLEKCLVKATLRLPDGRLVAMQGLDFSDPLEVIAARGGFHPMMSIEWTAGGVSSLQNVAIRLWKEYQKDRNTFFAEKAVEYKALAELLLVGCAKGFYSLPEFQHDGVIGFYASGQSVPIGHGWSAVNFYYRDFNDVIKAGGSLISSWVIFPAIFYNPLTGQYYQKDLMDIPLHDKDLKVTFQKYELISKNRTFRESEFMKEIKGNG